MRLIRAMLVSSVMMRKLLSALPFLIAAAVAAQQSDAQKVVAVVNGETITLQKLDQMYARMGAQLRQQYEKAGGKMAFLDNYIKKRLLIQEAIKAGFDKRPEIQADMEAAKEATIFDRYVRDVVSNNVLKDTAARQYYDEHPDEFATPERLHVRHIVITAMQTGPNAKSKEQALERIKALAAQLHESNFVTRTIKDPKAAEQLRVNQFKQLARQYSEDASGENGGDLGWLIKGQLDPDFEAAAWNLKIGIPSGIVETKFGYHLILVDDKQPAGTEPFSDAKASIREYLMTQHAAEVMETVGRLTNELRSKSKVAIYPENIR
jgi:peptidyl-prolyl cis-trans isomerase C